jgi:hypothetical protein
MADPKEYSAAHPLTHVDALRHPLKMGDELVCLCCGAKGIHNEEHVKNVEEYEDNSRWLNDEGASSWVKVTPWIAKLREQAARATAPPSTEFARVARVIRAIETWTPEQRSGLAKEMRERWEETRYRWGDYDLVVAERGAALARASTAERERDAAKTSLKLADLSWSDQVTELRAEVEKMGSLLVSARGWRSWMRELAKRQSLFVSEKALIAAIDAVDALATPEARSSKPSPASCLLLDDLDQLAGTGSTSLCDLLRRAANRIRELESRDSPEEAWRRGQSALAGCSDAELRAGEWPEYLPPAASDAKGGGTK